MDYLKLLVNKLLFDDNFPLIPHIPIVSDDDKFLFGFFKNLNSELIINEILKNTSDNDTITRIFRIVHHYKGTINISKNINLIDYENFINIKEFIDAISIEELTKRHYKEILLNYNGGFNIDDLLNYVLLVDFDFYFDYAHTNNLDVIKKIFIHNNEKIFSWINKHTNKYSELKKLDQPNFIINHMNGRLDVNSDTLKYFFEICPIDLLVYKELKKTLGLNIVYQYAGDKLHIDFIFELIETLDELILILDVLKNNLTTVEYILTKLKNKLPLIYENFNSLMFIKNDFNNK